MVSLLHRIKKNTHMKSASVLKKGTSTMMLIQKFSSNDQGYVILAAIYRDLKLSDPKYAFSEFELGLANNFFYNQTKGLPFQNKWRHTQCWVWCNVSYQSYNQTHY